MSTNATRSGRRIACTIALVALSMLPWSGRPAAADEAVTLGGPFDLVDHNGATRTDRDFHGSYPLIYFGFTHCPDLCPTSLSTMGEALDTLAKRSPAKAGRVVLVFITVDPQRDTAALLKAYVANFHARLVGLTGTPEQIDDVTRNYGAFSAPVPMGEDAYMMDHSGYILLMGPAGEYLTHFGSNVHADELATALEERIAK